VLTVVSKVSKGFASKGAEAVGKGMKSLGDNSRDFLAASMAMEQVGKSFGVSGPAMGILAAEFKSQTMQTRIDMMTSLLDLVQSEGGKMAIDNLSTFFNGVFTIGGDIVDVVNVIANNSAVKDMAADISDLFVTIGLFNTYIQDTFIPTITDWWATMDTIETAAKDVKPEEVPEAIASESTLPGWIIWLSNFLSGMGGGAPTGGGGL